MVNIKKIQWIPVLMIISQLMLAGFVAYWLKSQYDEEKKLLRDELSRIYDESRNQVIDSMLFNRVVEPALKDSVTITMMANDRIDTVNHKVIRNPKTAMGAAYAFSSKKQDFLIRSVKLFINHTGDTISSQGALPAFLPGTPDTGLFRKIYREKVAKKGYGVVVTWNGEMHFTSVFPDNLPGVKVSHDFPYLIRRIFAQILFALILLVLTGSAFFFTDRSLKRQMILNSLRNDFVSNITHELKTPVSTVKVAIEALKTFDKVSNPEITRDYLDMAGQELNRLDQLISKVLDQSLIGEQKQVIQLQPSDLKILIDTVLLSLQPRLTAQHASVKFEPSQTTGLIMVDPLHFQGLMCNLIDNSLKYGPENPEITIRLWEQEGSAFIEVLDNGPGIPREYLGRVFDKFFRVPTGDRHNIKGYGLGLSFAALVMKQHRGSISVKNLDQGGCSFTLRFPLKTS